MRVPDDQTPTPAAEATEEPPPAGRRRKTTTEAPSSTPQPADVPAGSGAPYPGAGFFHAGRHHPLFRAMGRRLVAEGAGRYTGTPGGDWTLEHARSYAAWQEQQGVEPTGTPDEQSWAALRVPKS